MGCVCGKPNRASKYALSEDGNSIDANTNFTAMEDNSQQVSSHVSKTAGTLAASGNIVNTPRPKLDPKDFQFMNGKDEVKIKLSGSINGQSFMIDKCENCDIYLLDHCGQVTMDDCKNCRVYIGPTDGSVFVRDCTGCALAVVCRQLRTRDCSSCNVALYCRTKPIIESSCNMGFACLDLPYPELRDHMQHAKLSALHNFWYDIFDFTPKDGNWRLLPSPAGGIGAEGDADYASSSASAALLEPIPGEVAELLRGGPQGGQRPDCPLLLTLGSRQPTQHPDGGNSGGGVLSYMFVAFEGAKTAQALQLARTAAEKGWLLRTNEARLSLTAAAALAAEAGWSKAVGRALGAAAGAGSGGCVGLELSVPEPEAATVLSQVSEVGGHVSGSEAAGRTFRSVGLEG